MQEVLREMGMNGSVFATPPCLMELLIMVETAWIEVGTAWEILLMRITVLALLISAVGR